MTLYDLFHPLVSYMVSCRYESMAGRAPGQDVMLGRVMRELARIRKTGAAAPEIAPGLDDACTYTAFYIDYMVHEGGFPFAREWQDLGRSQYNELAGDEKFFDYMNRWLEENTELAHDHLRLMHAMVTSGFAGAYERRHVQLESLMRRVTEQIGMKPESDAARELLSPEDKDERAPIALRHPLWMGILVMLLGGGSLVTGVMYYLRMYAESTIRLCETLNLTRDYIQTEAKLHAHNSDSLVVSPYVIDDSKPQNEPPPPEQEEEPPADEPSQMPDLPEEPEPLHEYAQPGISENCPE